MKAIFLVCFVALSIGIKAQIVVEHKYDSASTYGVFGSQESQLMFIKFESSGESYVNINRKGKIISVYNMNHALVKTISLATMPGCNGPASADILYLSEKLFDTDSLMEFMYSYGDCGNAVHTKVYKEDGTCIFTADSMSPLIRLNVALQQYPIYNTSLGTKMILSDQNTNKGDAIVYGLGGTLTTAIQIANQNLMQAQGRISNPTPNPVINTTRIEYMLPKDISQGEIVFYDQKGIEVKRFKVDKTFDHLLISSFDIPAGTYYYILSAGANSTGGKKMVVIK